MSTSTDIVTEALEFLKEPPASGDETFGHAYDLAQMYARESLRFLEGYPWNFASEKEQLTASEPTPVDWDYGFTKPGRCCRLIKVSDRADMRSGEGIRFEDRKNRILTNSQITWLWYVDGAYADMPGAWSQAARSALAAQMALKQAPRLSVSKADMDGLEYRMRRLLRQARLQDAQAGGAWEQPPSEWQQARRGARLT